MNLISESKLSPLLTGFRKNHSTQNALLNMTENMKHALDKGRKVSTVFMDLSKEYLHSSTLNFTSPFIRLLSFIRHLMKCYQKVTILLFMKKNIQKFKN